MKIPIKYNDKTLHIEIDNDLTIFRKINNQKIYAAITEYGHYYVKIYKNKKFISLGKYLYSIENCEHINGNKLDFRSFNLRERESYDNKSRGKTGEKYIRISKSGKFEVYDYVDAVGYVKKKTGRPSAGLQYRKPSSKQLVYIGSRETLEEAIVLRESIKKSKKITEKC